jgi:site-specific DNA-methyltransferase (adenine-specific)
MFVFVKGKLNTFHGLRTNTLHPGNKRKCKPGHRNQRGEFKMSYGRIVGNSKLLGNIWSYDVGYGRMGDLFASEHPAIFPEKLAEDHLLSWSNPGDVVLDPMCGSGTTCKMAAKHGRQYVGIDIAEKYCEIARKRVALIEAQPLLFNENAGEQSLARDPRKRGASSVI